MARQLSAVATKTGSDDASGLTIGINAEDADLERAVNDGIDDAMRNTGQACGALTRMLVPESRYEEAKALYRRALALEKNGTAKWAEVSKH